MINMKIENIDDKVIIYLYNDDIDINDIEALNKKIKDVFIKIMKRGNYDFFGYSRVNIYHNENYGIILEVEKIYNSGMNYHTIDLKIVVYKDSPMYLEFDDYYGFNLKDVLMMNGKYYLEINNKISIYKYIEFGKIKYKKLINEID